MTAKHTARAVDKPVSRMPDAAVCAILAAGVIAVYWRTLTFGFTNYDDNLYVTQNQHVAAGLTAANAVWAFVSVVNANWHPLTWLSLMLDASIGGLNPAVFHATNVALHLANVIILYVLLSRLTDRRAPSAIVAALFALHPMRVESVAWVSERKDVLSGLFWMLTIASYAAYVRKPGLLRYLAVAVVYAAGLMSKPMLVTLPFVLMLLDAWPLRRFAPERLRPSSAFRIIWDRLPLLAMAMASSVVAVIAQQKGQALADLASIPPGVRIANALVNYWHYIGKSLLPINLLPIYPNPGDSLPVWMAPVSALGLAAAAAAATVFGKKRPYIAVGWWWFVITLIPVIGLVQIGRQSIADRYTYLPHIGLFIMIAWGAADLFERCAAAVGRKAAAFAFGIPAAAAIGAIAFVAYNQTAIWRDDYTLHSYTVETAPLNPIGHFNLAHVLIQSDRLGEAEFHLRRAIELDPDYPEAHSNLGAILSKAGRHEEAVEHCLTAIRQRPNFADAYGNLGAALLGLNRLDEAAEAFRRAIRLNPNNASFEYGLGQALARGGRPRDAVGHFRRAVAISPQHLDAHSGLAISLALL